MILENSPRSLRGELSRWLIEPSAGVFLGNPSARVRDELWGKAVEKSKDAHVLQVWSATNAQGFQYRQHNPKLRKFIDVDGIALILFSRGAEDNGDPIASDSCT